MTSRAYARLALGTTIVAAGLAAMPTAALAAGDAAKLAAVTELNPQTGRNMTYVVGQGEVVPARMGVTNLADADVKGLVVEFRVIDDLDFAKKYDNCWYAVDSNADEAWCEFDASLAPGATLGVSGDVAQTAADAKADRVTSIMFHWVSKDWADQQGGVQALADGFAGQGTKAVRGTETGLSLAAATLPLPTSPNPINFAYARLSTPAPSPSATPSATPTPEPSGSSATTSPTALPTEDGGSGGGMPVTGPQSATMAGVGAALLLIGGVGYLVARRRTRFEA